ncbi:hydroxyacylglutathione hydrolase [Microbulbifer sp. SA54]|uniref:hydroxyacylglutathione hydrolase n=1 Tax=Microbulbifer sp. SA54 TaxID=3401577 RepID=UPI003AADAA6D
MITISPIPAFNDNYIWHIEQGSEHWVVDPGDARPAIETLGSRTLTGILVTHHHFDHTGGIAELAERYRCPVIGPESIELVTQPVKDGDRLTVLGCETTVMAVPGHTLDHIAFLFRTPEGLHLFCGDTLFAAGCGRLFEGSPEQMYTSLETLRQLPAETLVYCAHEYTQANLAFAAAVEPENPAIQHRQEETKVLRAQKKATLPSNIQLEIETNPFLRCNTADVRAQAIRRGAAEQASAVEIFATLRQWKDTF